VFGSHVANVIRRLKRIARFYGVSPLFILTSATIANPQEHGRAIIGDDLVSIHQDDAPHGPRTTLLYNPPVVHKETGIRKSATSEVIQLADQLLDANVQVLIFSRSRRGVEMLLRQLRAVRHDDPSTYHSYRSGYLAADRRQIEADLRSGKLRAVAATNALELGVDIGGIDAVLLTGYPGSIAAMRQQAGRAGRKTDPSLAVLVATGNPIDQYLVRHPDYLIGQSPESALIDADHPIILLGHLRCAAFELPFSRGEKFGSVDQQLLQEYLDFMAKSGILNESGEKYFWTDSVYPASTLSLRSSDSRSITLSLENENETTGRTIGEIDYSSALWMVHPNAIYLHEGNTYFVKNLDLEKSRAVLQEIEEDYFTDPVKKLTISKINERERTDHPGTDTAFGEIQVTTEITGYKKILWATREVLSVEPLSLPPTTMRTTAYWMAISDDTVASLRESLLWRNDANDYGKNWDKIRMAVRQRDQFRCQVCGLPESGKAHHVHHKAPLRSFLSLEEANRFENLITLCPNCHQLAEANVKIRSGLAGLGYSIGQIAPLFLMCDTTDIGTLTDPACSLADGKPAVILYDQVNAGIGLSKKCFDLHQDIMLSLQDLISHCACLDGCPSCVGPGGENGVGGKLETLAILDHLCREA
jgi:DEAD/DEAH box helicase domain-containing protein